MKKIDFLTVIPTDSLGGGAEQLLYNLTEYNIKNNLYCKVIFLSKKKHNGWEKLNNHNNIVYLPFRNVYIGYIFIFPVLIYLSITHHIKLTFTSQTLINSMMGFLKKIRVLKKTKVIVRESNSIFHLLKGTKLKLYALAYRLGYSKVDLVICQTEYMRVELLKKVPFIKNKTIVLNNPINTNLIKEKSKINIENLPKEKYIVAAGRLSPVKGFDILIYSFKILLQDFPNLKLLILGEGNEYNNLNQIITKENLNEKIKLVGFVENVYPYFKKAEMCVMSSRIEGFPNVLLQMMSQNNKIVTTKSAGDIDQILGLVTCEINDINGLAIAMKKCLTSNTSKNNRKLFDTNLKNRTLENFTKKVNEIIN